MNTTNMSNIIPIKIFLVKNECKYTDLDCQEIIDADPDLKEWTYDDVRKAEDGWQQHILIEAYRNGDL